MTYMLSDLIRRLQEIYVNEQRDVPVVLEGVKKGRFSNRITDLRVRPIRAADANETLKYVAIVDANKGWADWCLEAGEDND